MRFELILGAALLWSWIANSTAQENSEVQQKAVGQSISYVFATDSPGLRSRFDAPRLGFGYRLAGELSAWHFLIGVPF